MLRLLKQFKLVLLLIISVPNLATIAQNSIDVSIPVHGNALVTDGQQIYEIDTYDGQVDSLITYSDKRSISDLVWSASADQVAYLQGPGAKISIFNKITGLTHEVQSFTGREGLFLPQGWAADSSNILYLNYQTNLDGKGDYKLDLFNLSNDTLLPLSSYTEGQIISNFPFPSGMQQFRFKQIQKVVRNPVFDTWVVLQMVGANPDVITTNSESGETDEDQVTLNILWNYQTGQMLSLDNLYTDVMDSSFTTYWSPDGRYLQTNTFASGVGKSLRIIHFNNDSLNPAIEAIDTSVTSQVVYGWLGAGDLLITQNPSKNTPSADEIFYIAQIINGVLNTREFFRIPKTDFPAIDWADWHITASSEEKNALTCTFDQTLSTRMQLNQDFRIAHVDGTVRILQTEPGKAGKQLTSLSEGTVFHTIGGAICSNGYRWWHVQLKNRVIGWLAESDVTTYFLEPIPSITATKMQINETTSRYQKHPPASVSKGI